MMESLWKTALRSLLKTFFAFTGFFLAFTLLILIVSQSDSGEESIPSRFDSEILPNAKGVRKKMAAASPVILQLDIDGVIGLAELDQSKIENMLVESRENGLKEDRVKAILLKINSPGGTMVDADGIYRALINYKTQYKVPVIAYVDGLCASGGFYIACAADEIYANPISLIGSIGVISNPFLNFYKLIDKVGVEALTISRGKDKDNMDPLRPWKPDEDKNIQNLIQTYYDDFVNLVVKHRPKVSREALVNEYGAKVFPALEAEKLGLIDGANSSRESAIKRILAKLAIEDDYYQVVRLESTKWYNQLFSAQSPIITGKWTHEFKLGGNGPLGDKGPLLFYQQ